MVPPHTIYFFRQFLVIQFQFVFDFWGRGLGSRLKPSFGSVFKILQLRRTWRFTSKLLEEILPVNFNFQKMSVFHIVEN